MRFRTIATIVLACILGAASAGAQQPQPQVNLEPLRGEWIGKVDALASATDPGMRGFRLWAPRGLVGAGAHYVINGTSQADPLRLQVGDRAVSFSPKEGGTVSLRVTAPNEMTGTWTTAQGAASQVRFRRWEPTTTFDRDYSGRGEDRMSQCVGFLAKLQVRNSSLNGTFESNYLATSRIFDAMGSVWSNGELDLTAYDKDGTVAWVSRGKVENGRMRVTLKGGVNCGDLEFDLR